MLFFESIKKAFLVLQEVLFSWLFPIECLNCGVGCEWLCPTCQKRLKAELLVRKIYPEEGAFLDATYVVSRFSHKLMQRLIKCYKYNFITDLAPVLSAAWLEKLEGLVIYHRANLVISVPLHPRRLRWRGFDQSALLAQEFADYYRISYAEVLSRPKYNQPQAKLNKFARLTNIQGCFRAEADLKNQVIWLVDDVVTSGATLNECAKVLKAAGAKKVFGLCLAHG